MQQILERDVNDYNMNKTKEQSFFGLKTDIHWIYKFDCTVAMKL